MRRLSFAFAVASAVVISSACSQQPAKTETPVVKADQPPAASATKKEHAFRGKVEQVDPKAKSLTVTNENIEGWMAPMTMSYSADKPEVYDTVKPGDQITAKVYDGDLTLHDVQVVK